MEFIVLGQPLKRHPKRLIPKSKRSGYGKKRGSGFWIGAVLLVIFLIISLVGFLSSNIGYKPVYSATLTVVGTVGEGIDTPLFRVYSGQMITVRITNMNKFTGHSLVIMLNGGGSDWRKVIDNSETFKIPVTKDSMYYVGFSVNSIFSSGKITFKVIVDV